MTIKQAAMWLCQPGIVSMIHDPTTKKALRVAVKALAEPELGTNLAEVGTDCISRQQAIEAFRTYFMDGFDEDKWWNSTHVLAAIEGLPPAEPKRGRWIYHIDDLFPAESTKECDQCHAEQPLICDDEFCPHCGAKMEVNSESN